MKNHPEPTTAAVNAINQFKLTGNRPLERTFFGFWLFNPSQIDCLKQIKHHIQYKTGKKRNL